MKRLISVFLITSIFISSVYFIFFGSLNSAFYENTINNNYLTVSILDGINYEKEELFVNYEKIKFVVENFNTVSEKFRAPASYKDANFIKIKNLNNEEEVFINNSNKKNYAFISLEKKSNLIEISLFDNNFNKSIKQIKVHNNK